MTVLILADHHDGTLSPATARLVSAAARFGGAVDILLAGPQARPAAETAAALSGVRRVLLAEDQSLEHALAEPLSALLVELAPGYRALLAAAASVGKDVLPRVAALLDVMQISEIIGIDAPDTFRRPIYAGNAVETVRTADPIVVATIRAPAFPPAGPAQAQAPIEPLAVALPPTRARYLGIERTPGDRPDLSSARIVVSGGRALGSREGFEAAILPLAEKLGAAIGASRAAVDAGYVPNDWQIGQTGRVVAPELYIAIGISGAIQHVGGMKESKVIVAINKDPEAPIFAIADYGLVADLFEALPELVSKL